MSRNGVAVGEVGRTMSRDYCGTTCFSAVLVVGCAGKLGWGFGLQTMWIVLGNTLVGSLLVRWVLVLRRACRCGDHPVSLRT